MEDIDIGAELDKVVANAFADPYTDSRLEVSVNFDLAPPTIEEVVLDVKTRCNGELIGSMVLKHVQVYYSYNIAKQSVMKLPNTWMIHSVDIDTLYRKRGVCRDLIGAAKRVATKLGGTFLAAELIADRTDGGYSTFLTSRMEYHWPDPDNTESFSDTYHPTYPVDIEPSVSSVEYNEYCRKALIHHMSQFGINAVSGAPIYIVKVS